MIIIYKKIIDSEKQHKKKIVREIEFDVARQLAFNQIE